MELFKAAAAQGLASAQNSVGVLYSQKQCCDQAVAFWRLAADRGHARAEYNLAVCYERGTGVERDHERAVELLEAAAVQGHEQAQAFGKW